MNSCSLSVSPHTVPPHGHPIPTTRVISDRRGPPPRPKLGAPGHPPSSRPTTHPIPLPQVRVKATRELTANQITPIHPLTPGHQHQHPPTQSLPPPGSASEVGESLGKPRQPGADRFWNTRLPKWRQNEPPSEWHFEWRRGELRMRSRQMNSRDPQP